MTQKAIVFGASGLIGEHLSCRLGANLALATFCTTDIPGGARFDVLRDDPRGLNLSTDDISHGFILFGETNIDRCARNLDETTALNVDATCRLIDWLVGEGITPVFTSSDMVFDGEKGGYDEAELAAPVLIYGRQKIAVEKYLVALGQPYLIVRYSKIVSSHPDRPNELLNWYQAIQSGRLIRCAADQWFSALDIEDAVTGLLALTRKNHTGLYHLGGPKRINRLELFSMLLAALRRHRPEIQANLEECSIRDFTEFAEPRPYDISMISDKLFEATGFRARPLEETCEALATAVYSK